jgi:hypothetical protein
MKPAPACIQGGHHGTIPYYFGQQHLHHQRRCLSRRYRQRRSTNRRSARFSHYRRSNIFGALLAAPGAWTVVVGGSILSQQSTGIVLDSGANGSSITIAKDGEFGGGLDGIYVESSVKIKNFGVITADQDGIAVNFAGAHTIINSGTITGAADSISDIGNLSNDTVTNFGTLNGDVRLAGGANKLTNFGTLVGTAWGGDDSDVFKNFGTITSAVALGAGANKLINAGTIGFNIVADTGNDTVIDFVKKGHKMDLGPDCWRRRSSRGQ